jgi:hypothetical protein
MKMYYLHDQCGMIHGIRYCWAITSSPSKTARKILCLKTRATIRPSLPTNVLVETPVVTFCGEIILLITPPEEFVAAIKTGLRWSCFAAFRK